MNIVYICIKWRAILVLSYFRILCCVEYANRRLSVGVRELRGESSFAADISDQMYTFGFSVV